MLSAYRIVKRRFAKTAFSGEGARLNGGRWNSVGVPLAYVAQSRSLATVEMLVHLDSTTPLQKYVLIEAFFPSAIVQSVKLEDLPANWNRTPAPRSLQAFGDAWARSAKSAVLRVPSVIIPGEFNYLINPIHRDFRKLKIAPAAPFRFDKRLLG